VRRAAVALGLVALAVGVGAGDARPAKTDTVTISMLTNAIPGPGYQVLIPNFERVYPNITVTATYAPTNPAWYQLESTELAAGNASDVLGGFPGCGTPVSICELAKAGDLTALVHEPWTKRSIRLVTSLGKYGQSLFGFEPTLSPQGVFTNDTLFQKLGLRIPQTFPQLLTMCQQAKADGTTAVLLAGATGSSVAGLIQQLAVATVYGPDPHFTAQQRPARRPLRGRRAGTPPCRTSSTCRTPAASSQARPGFHRRQHRSRRGRD
jgi:raffinose/stachyose/melibiose transport system substrate-binding protein